MPSFCPPLCLHINVIVIIHCVPVSLNSWEPGWGRATLLGNLWHAAASSRPRHCWHLVSFLRALGSLTLGLPACADIGLTGTWQSHAPAQVCSARGCLPQGAGKFSSDTHSLSCEKRARKPHFSRERHPLHSKGCLGHHGLKQSECYFGSFICGF